MQYLFLLLIMMLSACQMTKQQHLMGSMIPPQEQKADRDALIQPTGLGILSLRRHVLIGNVDPYENIKELKGYTNDHLFQFTGFGDHLYLLTNRSQVAEDVRPLLTTDKNGNSYIPYARLMVGTECDAYPDLIRKVDDYTINAPLILPDKDARPDWWPADVPYYHNIVPKALGKPYTWIFHQNQLYRSKNALNSAKDEPIPFTLNNYHLIGHIATPDELKKHKFNNISQPEDKAGIVFDISPLSYPITQEVI